MDKELREVSDEELLSQLAEKNQKAFVIIVKRHMQKFYGLAYRMLSNKQEAEDIIQDSFLALWENPGRYNASKNAKFTTWFYRVIVNKCLDKKRRIYETSITNDQEPQDLGSGTEEIINRRTTHNEIETYLSELPQSQQTAINLCFYQGVSNKEAAEIMGISLKALESLLVRGKQKLRSKINKKYNEVI